MKHIIALLFRSETALPAAPRALLAALLLTMACGLGGCASGGANNGSYAMAGGGTGGTTVYLSAQVSRGRTTIAWVWDVYDRDQQRALRLAGEEPAGKAGRDAWSAADDLILRKIAQAGLSGLSGMINGTVPAEAPPPEPAPDKRGPAVASTEPPAPASDAFSVSALGYSAH